MIVTEINKAALPCKN